MTQEEINDIKIGDTLLFACNGGCVKRAIVVGEHEMDGRIGNKIKVNIQFIKQNPAAFHKTQEKAENFAREEEIKNIQIFINLQGTPRNADDICLSNSHGYYAYVSIEVDDFVRELFREMSVWSGSTDTYKTRDYRYFKQFELDCASKQFLKSRIFKKICEHHNVKYVIMDNGDDAQIWREFWDQMQR